MRTTNMKKMRNMFKTMSNITFASAIAVIVYGLTRYEFQTTHDSNIFIRMFMITFILITISGITQVISTILQENIDSRYRRKHIKEQKAQLMIDHVRIHTDLH